VALVGTATCYENVLGLSQWRNIKNSIFSSALHVFGPGSHTVSFVSCGRSTKLFTHQTFYTRHC
jgi:hypothetical protein